VRDKRGAWTLNQGLAIGVPPQSRGAS
jgi:hypothetical protein